MLNKIKDIYNSNIFNGVLSISAIILAVGTLYIKGIYSAYTFSVCIFLLIVSSMLMGITFKKLQTSKSLN